MKFIDPGVEGAASYAREVTEKLAELSADQGERGLCVFMHNFFETLRTRYEGRPLPKIRLSKDQYFKMGEHGPVSVTEFDVEVLDE